MKWLIFKGCVFSGRGHIMRTGETAFKAISFEAAMGGGRIGVTPVWNIIRRWADKKYAISTDRTYGGPGTVPAWFTPRQLAELRRTMELHERPAWLERYFSVRLSVLDFAAFSLPDYDSRIATLPLYAGQEIVDGLESVERVLRETRIEEESVI
ncbi:hypothetical protein CPB85DRAFT_1279390 [Mucidula mucida]|nr:hypothetical protein CPB85DRAFT_1279390 [Mucidula mucida]